MKKSFFALALVLFAHSALASSLDLPGVFFMPAHPAEYETLKEALDPAHAAESLENLQTTADRLAEYPEIYFEIAGHADASECNGQECDRLSLRRATLVFRHLLKLGVDPARLDALNGRGIARPISRSSSEGLWLNRRVEINVAN